jgi:hypothetical protein|tara:strand:- start:849 stop:1097 length:249 start_codon:yes stop_codon:yes gene_type:complete
LGTDYQLLVGQHFDGNGVAYVVREVAWFENRWIAKADPVCVDDTVMRGDELRSFPVNYVLRRVVVEEEIELLPPHWGFQDPP